ncbi:thioredoxin domain-containing protein [Phenylobacterium sp.]|uniref:thioredoxin domain-containing protein n=1 Tax=Phenylobacterium sp. TaxID=1871053 RepID=UPI002730062C|nr:thioredoxin domain-containing protein [Phenylobacterium sp.]MDP1875751.1 thioredoxin domain-containing protein [Phenylobacterium sp.]MDP3488990.1 thioredoxin domain-containing protein [Phenylobacterium sp.]
MTQIVCPACAAANRIPTERNPAAAKCGRCGVALFQGQPTEVDARELQVHQRSNQGVAVLLDVWAPWCGPCRSMAPHFAAAAARLEPRVRLLKLNADEAPEASAALGVSGIPALILLQDGREVARRAGAMTTDQITAWVNQALAGARSPSSNKEQPQ